ncbi:MAG: PLP-dependent transferase, partial [Saprospiraceae bacterium]|nr:PLP-dependent transferase [Saprospiraceae bacterium]
MKNENNWDFETICAKELTEFQSGDAHILPINATSSFSYENVEDSIDVFTGKKEGYVYTRYGNPTITAIQNKLALLEGFDMNDKPFCVMCNSGLAAVTTLCISVLEAGDEMITQGNLYGGTTEIFKKILSRYGIKVHFTDHENEQEIEKLISENPKIKLLYFETPSNPTISCLDIKKIVDVVQPYQILTAIDNTFATPY